MLLKPIDLTPAESASGQQLAHPDRDDLMGVAFLSLVSVTLLAGKEDNWEIEKEMIDRDSSVKTTKRLMIINLRAELASKDWCDKEKDACMLTYIFTEKILLTVARAFFFE